MVGTWTDDLSVRVARGETLDSLVDYLIESEREGVPWPAIREVLTERFALSFDDARLVVDRVFGGRTRAATTHPANEPDRIKDPVAWISYRRARGEPTNVAGRADTAAEDREAESLWRDAYGGRGRTRGITSVGVAIKLAELATATAEAAGEDGSRKRNVLLQAATALSTAAEACIEGLGEERYARERSQAWIDGIALEAASRRIAMLFGMLGSHDLEARGFDLRGRIVTGLFGHCHARVGRAMLDSVRCAERAGDLERAADLCKAVVGDFAVLLPEWEDTGEAPFDEHRIALEHLIAALDTLASIGGSAADPEVSRMRARCSMVLART
jgi:hypothetical protein